MACCNCNQQLPPRLNVNAHAAAHLARAECLHAADAGAALVADVHTALVALSGGVALCEGEASICAQAVTKTERSMQIAANARHGVPAALGGRIALQRWWHSVKFRQHDGVQLGPGPAQQHQQCSSRCNATWQQPMRGSTRKSGQKPLAWTSM